MSAVDKATRDISIIEHILEYCADIESIHAEFGHSRERFGESKAYQNGVAMCILQIGELTKHLSADFVATYRQIPWRDIAQTRDVYAHHYGHADAELIWESATSDIPYLADFCQKLISKEL